MTCSPSPGGCLDKAALPSDGLFLVTSEITSNPDGAPVALARAGKWLAHITFVERFLQVSDATESGDIPVSFRIWAHFDPSSSCDTPEPQELPYDDWIVSESGQRPWYERRYARVDWSAAYLDGLLVGSDVASVETESITPPDATSDWDCGAADCAGPTWPPIISWQVRHRVLVRSTDVGGADAIVELRTTFTRASTP